MRGAVSTRALGDHRAGTRAHGERAFSVVTCISDPLVLLAQQPLRPANIPTLCLRASTGVIGARNVRKGSPLWRGRAAYVLPYYLCISISGAAAYKNSQIYRTYRIALSIEFTLTVRHISHLFHPLRASSPLAVTFLQH
jgi:hypothetical protein